jgi:hypothetical protein
MKKNNFVLLLIILFNIGFSQDKKTTSVEKSIFGVQTGLLGVWINNESKLSNEIALRTELGFDAGLFGGSFYPKTGFLMTPVLRIEPRWYYNLNKRAEKSRNISGNSGNFFTLQTTFNPNWFVISNYDNIKIVNQVSIVPTWGIKRVLGKHFTYETGIGIGLIHYFAKSSGYAKDENEAWLNLHLRLGYTF